MKPDEIRSVQGLAADLVAYQSGAVVSRTLIKKSAGTVTVFAFDAEQGLSEHTAPFDALVLVLDGRCRWTIDGRTEELGPGELVVLPAGKPHAVAALGRFKMLLVMIRSHE